MLKFDTDEALRKRVHGLIDGVLRGRTKEVFAEYYAPDAVIEEAYRQEFITECGANLPGRERAAAIRDDVQVHEMMTDTVIVENNRACIEWRLVVSAKGGVRQGEMFPIRQVWIQCWNDGKVVRELCYLA